ncbi:MAG TPA: FG-GAP-like repeat-containing protein [Candidatus Acidoferrum sp.]|jgi:Flp pilus assembly secretin CpaC
MTTQPIRQIAALLLSAMLLNPPASPQVPASASPSPSQRTAPNPDPKRAQKSVDRGEKAEASGQFDDALSAYDEAVRYAPQDLAAAAKAAALRSRLVRTHMQTAERLAIRENVTQAIAELHKAQEIDPANSVVTERLKQMQALLDDDPSVAPPSTDIPGIPHIKPSPGKQNFNLRGDTRSVYEQVGTAFGVKVAFDPDLAVRNVRLRADDLDFNTAMSILGAETITFWRPLNPTLIFIAADTIAKRREYGLVAEQTFLLPASTSSEDMTELLRILREITGSTRLQLDTRSRTISMRDSPDRLELAGAIIRNTQKARGEIMLDIQLLEVDRSKAQQLGLTPPSSTQAFLITPNDLRALAQSADISSALTAVGQIFNGQGITGIPPFVLVGGGISTFLLTLPGVAANFSDALNLVQSGTQVLLRAQDAKPATFFVGDRFPITLSTLSGAFGNGTSSAAVNASLLGVPSAATFPQTTFNVGNNPVALVSTDFNGDGLADLAVTNRDDNSISILLNQDNGNFVPQVNSPIALPTTETAPTAIAAGVLRNTLLNPVTGTTPIQDLVIANSTSNNVTVLLGNGDGTFHEAPGSPYPVGKNPSSIVLADFNGDGFQDFAVANKDDNSISVFKGDGNGNFVQFATSPFLLRNSTTLAEQGPTAIAVANLRNAAIINNVAEADLAIVNQTSNNLTILLNSVDVNGNVFFTEAANSPIPVGQSPAALAVGDLNGDGVQDLAVVNQGDDSITLLIGSPQLNGTFNLAASSPLQTGATPAGVTIANFTGSVPDLAVTNQGVGTLGVYIGLGAATFSPRIELPVPASPIAITSAALTTNGLPDVVLTALGSTPNQGVVAIIQDSPTFATGNSAQDQVAFPGAEYVDLGVKVKATPTLHPNHEVTLQLDFEIRALSGTNVNGIPVITNRTLSQTIRIKEDETSILGGLLDKEETRAITGLPGLANLPTAGYAFGNRNNTSQDNEFLILITPHRLRTPVRNNATIYAGHGDATTRGSSTQP